MSVEDAHLQQDLARRYGLSQLHPAVSDVATLTTRVKMLEEQLGRPLVIERGPWSASPDGAVLYSDDFTHDVMLTVNGDFGSYEDRKAYADEIARRLNNFQAQQQGAKNEDS